MRRWILYSLAALGILFLPKGQEVDIGSLIPVELIHIYKEQDRIMVTTETGDSGNGTTLEKALEDLRATAFGVVFLDTVEYVLVTEESKDLVAELKSHFRLSTNVILATAPIDTEKALQFLAIHNPEVTLKDHLVLGTKLPKFMKAGDRYYVE